MQIWIKSRGQFALTITPAHPKADHARHFFQLAEMAGDGVYTQLFGARASTVLESMFLTADNDFSHANISFLEVDDRVAGMLNAYPARYSIAHSRRTLRLKLRFAGFAVFSFLATTLLMRDVFAFMADQHDTDDLYIFMLAIYPQFRGRGYSKALLAHARQLAIAHSCSRLALDVDERNVSARAAYRSAGFEQVAESKIVLLDGGPLRLLRLAKPVARSA